VEKLVRIGVGTLNLEGVPAGRYRLLSEKEVQALRASWTEKKSSTESAHETRGVQKRRFG
jgi:hypothetical protein